ncbi:MAG: hypothetical protein RL368_610 [Pseudomonadota bacterium]|jgi:ParB family chromosome partitioning protein
MNRLSPAIVLVKKIQCTFPRQQHSESAIEIGAQLILQLGGVITPLILRREGIDAYQLVSGTLEYYAALRAKELDLKQAETINAYIIEENEASILEQIKLFRSEKPHFPEIDNMNTVLNEFDKASAAFSTGLLQQVQALMAGELEKFKAEFASKIIVQKTVDLIPEAVVAEPIIDLPEMIEASAPETVVIIAPEITLPKPAPKTTRRKKAVVTTAPPVIVEPKLKPSNPAVIESWLSRLNTLPEKELFFILTHQKVKNSLIIELAANRPFANEVDVTKIKGVGGATLSKIQQALTA